MTAAALAAALALLSTNAPAAPADKCAGVVDATAACPSPASLSSTVKPDAKPAPKPAWDGAVDPGKLPGEFGFVAAGLAVVGGGVLTASYLFAPQSRSDEQVQALEQIGGASILVGAALVATSGVALSVFDPSTGAFRPKSIYEGAD